MPNFQPNFVYSPKYGNRYMGGSRNPAPSVGKSGQVDRTVTAGTPSQTTPVDDSSAVVQDNLNWTTPYFSVPEAEQGPVGWSGTGRDQSAVEELGTFGFRSLDSMMSDPFEDSDYFSTPSVETTTKEVPEISAVPSLDVMNDDSDNDSLGYFRYDSTSPNVYDSTPRNDDELIAALSNYGSNALMPGSMLANMYANYLTGKANEEEIKALEAYNFATESEFIDPVINKDGTITYKYKDNSPYANSTLTAEQFYDLQSQLKEGDTIQGITSKGNVNITKADGTTVRAGVSPNTGQVNTYNFNVDKSLGATDPSGLDADGNNSDDYSSSDANGIDDTGWSSSDWSGGGEYWSAGGKVTGMLSKDPFEGYF